jgi:CRP/FNR family cyclic AMP-dependent transcriptional regulator
VTDTAALDQLRDIPFFGGLGDDELAHVAGIATELSYPRGMVLIERGLPGSGMFVILDGTVAVELPHRTVELGPGELVGELALLTDQSHRTARVRAVGDVRCLAIGRTEFAQLIEDHPRIAVSMLPVLAARVVDVIENSA